MLDRFSATPHTRPPVTSEQAVTPEHVYVPHVVAWNLTRRCNLTCAHCYIAAGPAESAATELPTRDCLRIVEEILAVNPSPMLILSGGEPLLRDDLEEIAAAASSRGATAPRTTSASR